MQRWIALVVLIAVTAFVCTVCALPVIAFGLIAAHVYSDKRLIEHWEIIDLESVPLWFKNYLQDIMMYKWVAVFSKTPPLGGLGEAVSAMESLLRLAGRSKIVALACGAGGLETFLQSEMNRRAPDRVVQLVLTDLHPNVQQYRSAQVDSTVTHHPDSVDALNLPSQLAGEVFSLTGSLHHFNEQQVGQLLQTVVGTQSSVMVLDGVSSLKAVLLMPLRSFCWGIAAGVWYGVARRDLRQLALTLSLVLPLAMSHDALVSALRFYSRAQMEKLIAAVPGSDSYEWDLSRWGSLPECSILLAYPKPKLTRKKG